MQIRRCASSLRKWRSGKQPEWVMGNYMVLVVLLLIALNDYCIC
jgi:hypothetical protein